MADHPGPLDLALVDVVMPRMGGSEFGDRLRRTRPTLRVVYMSGLIRFRIAVTAV